MDRKSAPKDAFHVVNELEGAAFVFALPALGSFWAYFFEGFDGAGPVAVACGFAAFMFHRIAVLERRKLYERGHLTDPRAARPALPNTDDT